MTPRTMMHLFLICFLLTACVHVPAVRPGPAIETRFAPPPKGALQERWSETRETTIEFQGGERRRVKEELGGEVIESYAPLPDGWRVTSTMTSEGISRNGRMATLPLSLAGVAFSHRIDAKGQFVEPLDLDESAREMRERVRDKRLFDLLDAAATPEALATRIRQGWQTRYENGLCNATLEPGDVSFAIEEQQLPAGGLVRMVVRRTVLGGARTLELPTVEIALEYGGASSRFVTNPEVQRLLVDAGGVDALTPNLEGTGRRFMTLSGCHALFDSSDIKGTVVLHEADAYAPGQTGLPERVRFSVTRRIERKPITLSEK